MKTMKIASFSLMTGMILLAACSKDESDAVPASNPQTPDFRSTSAVQKECPYVSWREDFLTATTLSDNWYLFGSPKPKFVNFAGNRFGLFDNNGQSPTGSYAVSKARIGDGTGYSIESDVLIDVTKPAAGIICPEIGITRNPNQSSESVSAEAGISMKLIYVGPGTPTVQRDFQNQLFLVLTVLSPDGRLVSTGDPRDASTAQNAIKVNADLNNWHKMKIVVSGSRQVSFYLDNKLVSSPKMAADPSMLINKNVLLGFTSPGTSGKAYHDYVQVTYPFSPEMKLLVGSETPKD